MAEKKEKKYIIENSALMAEWDWEKNNELGLNPNALTTGSNKFAWWICNNGHSWDDSINHRTAGRNCPYCSNHRVYSGYNDLQTIRPDLSKEWNIKKNSPVLPSEILAGSHKKVWWICPVGHEYEMSISARSRGVNCPVCKGRRIIIGANDLATTNPELILEWNTEKNGALKPTDVVAGSAKKMWWKCSNGHEWQARISHRANGIGCPYCSGRNVIQGVNDLITTHPQIAKEWNHNKNSILPSEVSAGSGKTAWWVCDKGHEWQAVVYSRCEGNGCPICANQKVLVGYNDLQTVNERVAKEWNYDKNVDLRPSDIVANSHQKVWWVCKKGHEWQAVVMGRCSGGHNCPICAIEKQTSFPEKIIFYYIKKAYPNTIENYRPTWLKRREIDIFIPEISVGIEYDGQRWHKNVSLDNDKNEQCYSNGVKLIRIREPKCPHLNGTSCDYYLSDTKISSLKQAIYFTLDNIGYIDLPTDFIDFDRDLSEIYSMVEFSEKEKSLLKMNPILSNEWNSNKNGNLTPNDVSYRSGKKAWWKCSNGHEWQATIASRYAGSGCPYCYGRKAISGRNDLQTVNPTLAAEWDYENNFPLVPSTMLPNSSKKVWWKCSKCNFKWESTISNRSKGNGCPNCYRHKKKNG